MTSMKIAQFSGRSTTFAHLRPTFFHLFDLGPPVSNELPLQMINNQLKENIIQRWILYVIRSYLQVGLFFFSINSLILSGFPLTSFHLTEALLSAFSWPYTLVVAAVQKYREMTFVYNYSHL